MTSTDNPTLAERGKAKPTIKQHASKTETNLTDRYGTELSIGYSLFGDGAVYIVAEDHEPHQYVEHLIPLEFVPQVIEAIMKAAVSARAGAANND